MQILQQFFVIYEFFGANRKKKFAENAFCIIRILCLMSRRIYFNETTIA